MNILLDRASELAEVVRLSMLGLTSISEHSALAPRHFETVNALMLDLEGAVEQFEDERKTLLQEHADLRAALAAAKAPATRVKRATAPAASGKGGAR